MAGKNGGARPGAGRKPNAIEENVKACIKKAMADCGGEEEVLTEIWKKIIQMAKSGSEKHQTIFLNYFHGKPKENLEQPTEMIINVVRKH